MNSLLITNSVIKNRSENFLEISSPKIYQHLSLVLNKSNENKKQKYKVTLLNEGIFEATILKANETSIQLQLEGELPSFEPWIDVIIGASRPQTTKKILEHGTTFGLGSFHFFTASLSEKSYLTSKVFTEEKEQYLHDGLSQSARYYQLPEVTLHHRNPADLFKEYDYKFVLDFEDAKTFLEVQLPDLSKIKKGERSPKMVIALGPERGFRKIDLDPFLSHGFQKVTISRSVLRVEHALFASLGQLEMLVKKY